MEQHLQWPQHTMYAMVQVLVHGEHPVFIILGVVRSIKLGTGELRRTFRLVEEVPEVRYTALRHTVGRSL